MVKKAVKKAAPKTEAVAPVEDSPVVNTDSFNIRMIITAPNGEEFPKEITISNAAGCIQRSCLDGPDEVFNPMYMGLVQKLGNRHVK